MKNKKSKSFGACAYRSWAMKFAPRKKWESLPRSEKAWWGAYAKALAKQHDAAVFHSIASCL